MVFFQQGKKKGETKVGFYFFDIQACFLEASNHEYLESKGPISP